MTNNTTESNPKNSRRWWQFSIRTLMIASAVFAIATGVFFQRMRTQKRAVAKIQDLGGQVTYQDTWLGKLLPESIRKSVGDHYAANAVSVNLSYRTVDRRMTTASQDKLKQIVDAVQRLPHVKSLSTDTLKLKDEDLAIFAPLKSQIEELTINEYFHEDFRGFRLDLLSDWKRLRKLSIYSLILVSSDPAVKSKSPQPGLLNLEPLSKLPRLDSLAIGYGTLEKEVFAGIAELQNLKRLSLSSCRFDGSHLSLLRKLDHLETLWLYNTHAVADFGPYLIREDGTKKFLEEPTFRFEQSRDEWWEQPGFPQDKYDKWIKETLGDVEVIQLFIS